MTDSVANPRRPPEDSLLHRNVLDSMSEGVLTVTADGRIGSLNPAAARLLDLAGAEVRGRTIAEVFLDREGLEEFNDAVLAAVYDETVGARSTVRLWPGDDAERVVAVTTSYFVIRKHGETRRIGIVAVLDDVTEVEALRRAEQEMAEATRAQNVELRDAYREIETKNQALDTALKKMTVVRVGAMVLVALLFAGAAWYAWNEAGAAFPQGTAQASAGAPPQEALTVTVTPRRLVSTVSFVGRLAPREVVRVTSRSAGKVGQVFFEYGARVTAGQALVALDTAEIHRRYRDARAVYLEARDKLRELENWESGREVTRARRAVALAKMELESRESKLAETVLLLAQGVIPASEHRAAEQQYEAQRMRYEAARQDLEVVHTRGDTDAVGIARLRLANAETRMGELEKTLEEAVVTAPLPGVVLQPGGGGGSGKDDDERPLAAGRLVSEGGYLLSIADLGGLSVVGRIDEVDVVKVKPGQPVRVSGDAFPDLVFEGRIEHISFESRSKAGARVPEFDVTAAIERLTEAHLARLRLGMSANVTVVVRDEPAALLLPLDAVRGGAGNYRVRLQDKDGGAPREVRVEVGETTLYEVEVVHGLEAGDEVIVAGR